MKCPLTYGHYILRYHICFKSKENLAIVHYSYIDVVTEKQYGGTKVMFATNKNK